MTRPAFGPGRLGTESSPYSRSDPASPGAISAAAAGQIPALAAEQFPGLLASPGITYLDSAATTQRPGGRQSPQGDADGVPGAVVHRDRRVGRRR